MYAISPLRVNEHMAVVWFTFVGLFVGFFVAVIKYNNVMWVVLGWCHWNRKQCVFTSTVMLKARDELPPFVREIDVTV